MKAKSQRTNTSQKFIECFNNRKIEIQKINKCATTETDYILAKLRYDPNNNGYISWLENADDVIYEECGTL